jgi:hypothetical protein
MMLEKLVKTPKFMDGITMHDPAKFRCLMIGCELTPDGEAYEQDAVSRHETHKAHWDGEELTDAQKHALERPIERRRPTRQRTT